MLNRREFLAAVPLLAAAQKRERPNIVLIVVDDWGWTDLGCYGSKYYETPNLDRLASQGIRFTQAYSACTVCSPSRAAILTGKYPARLHITDWIPGHKILNQKLRPPDWTQHLPHQETTIAEAIKPAGYMTAAIGKWHLGGPQYWPETQGFDRSVAGTDKGSPPAYFSPYKIATLPDGPAGEYLTDRECNEAIRFMEENRDKPFFVYLPHHAVHTPLQAKKEKIAKYRDKPDAQGDPVYAAMVESLDESAGTIMRKIDELGIANRTVVMITSDNGGLLRSTSNAPLRAGKGTVYEGGVRVPLIIRWPGVVRAGSICDVPVMGIDLHPTALDIAGVKTGEVDGLSLLPLLKGGKALKRDALFWHYPHYHNQGASPYSAIRERDLRLVEFHEDGKIELYDLAADISEKNDLAKSRPDVANRLRKRLASWRQSVGAQMAPANPDYDPAKADKRFAH
jgi:arylsulfatase A-like enzyme